MDVGADGLFADFFDFFTPQPLWFGRGEGFALFSDMHRSWIIACVLLVYVLTRWYWWLGRVGTADASARRHRARLAVAVVPLALMAFHSALMARAGAFTVEWWPLHLCNVCELLALFHALHPDEFSGETLVGLGIPASLLAILFPGWTVAPWWSLPSVCGFVEHALVLASALFVIAECDVRPQRDHVLRPLAFLAGYAVLVYPFNQRFGTNFAFVAWPAAGSPLELWASMYGNPGYLVPYAVAIALIVWGVMGLWGLVAKYTYQKR